MYTNPMMSGSFATPVAPQAYQRPDFGSSPEAFAKTMFRMFTPDTSSAQNMGRHFQGKFPSPPPAPNMGAMGRPPITTANNSQGPSPPGSAQGNNPMFPGSSQNAIMAALAGGSTSPSVGTQTANTPGTNMQTTPFVNQVRQPTAPDPVRSSY